MVLLVLLCIIFFFEGSGVLLVVKLCMLNRLVLLLIGCVCLCISFMLL